jgi:phenylacetate-CoA ligase
VSVLDRLRTSYVSAPPLVRRVGGTLAGRLPPRWRFGRVYMRTLADLRRAETEPDFVIRYQEEALDGLLAACADRSPFYRRVFAEHGLARPRAGDLAKLPVLTKEEIRGRETELLVRPLEDLDLVTTSGSSGQPLRLHLDRDRSVREWAYLNHIWSWIGYRPGDVRATVRYAFSPRPGGPLWEYDPGLRELRISPFHLTPDVMDEYLRQVARHRVRFLHGYPSALMVLAMHAIRSGWRPPESLRGVLPISEVMHETQRRLVSEAFGSLPVQPVFGMSEKVAIAGERGGPFTYEFLPLYGFTEILDEAGRPVSPGERGRLVATGFICPGMPLVRYDTGDQATLVGLPRRANGWRLVARNPSSKWAAEFLVGRHGAPIGLTNLVFPNDAYDLVREYQYYQDTPGVAVMRVVALPGATSDALRPIVEEMAVKTGGNLEIRVEVVEELPAARGKRKHVDQRIPLSDDLERVLAAAAEPQG